MEQLNRFLSLLAALLLITLISSPAQESTGTIRGHIMDKVGKPIPDIHIVLKGTNFGAITDSDGHFTIQNIEARNYTLIISGLGFNQHEKKVEVKPETTVKMEIHLSESLYDLEQIEVMGQLNSFHNNYEKTRAVDQLDDETVRNFNSTNAYDALRVVPGISFIHGAGNRNGKPSRIRGASTWAIPDVIEDFPSIREAGIGAEDGGLTADFGSSIPSIALQSIEVKKGSLGVLYSGDADGGVIVNKLKQGHAGKPKGSLWLESNPIAEQLVMGDVSGGNGTFDYYVAGKLLNGKYTEFVDQFGRTLQNDRFYSGLTKLGFTPSKNMRMEFIGLRGQDRINYSMPKKDDANTEIDESHSLASDFFETTNNTDFYGLNFKHGLNENITYEVGYSLFLNKAYRYSITESQAHRDRPESSHTAFGNIYLNYALSTKIDYSSKIGFERINHQQKENAFNSNMEQSFLDRSLFYAHSLTIADRLTLSAGVRLLNAEDDFQSHTGAYYDGGVAYQIPTVETMIRASYSTGYSRNKGFAFFFGPIKSAGGVELSQNQTYEVGLEQPFSFGGSEKKGHAEVTLFRNLNSNVPIFSGWGAETVYYEEHRTDGIEMSVDYNLGQWGTLFSNFTFLDPVITATTHPKGIGVESTSVPVPQYAAAMGLDVHPTKKLSISAITSYNDGQRSRQINLQTGEITTTTSSSYTRINLSGNYQWSKLLTTLVRVENLLNQKDLGFNSETRGPNGVEVTTTVAKDPGRFVSIAAILNF
ncbi:MAG: TonB-dependent receptor [Anditalea sp.]